MEEGENVSKTLKRIIVILLVIFTLNNFFINSFVFAEVDAEEDVPESFISKSLKTIRVLALAIARAMNNLTASIAYTESPDATDSDGNNATLSPYDILFNKVPIVDVNFFDVTNDDTIVMTIRRGISTWYYTMRVIASAILLAVLVYIGIRMAISTIASEQALYKKMLVDWAVSVALIFLLSFIIVFVFNVNSALVNTIRTVVDNGSASQANSINESIEKIGIIASSKTDINSISATIVYVLLIWQTLGLLISYFSRMLKLAFLLIIAPLITLTYAIDKIGDGKAQALNAWLREFMFTILIQPFHCIIYAVLISTSLSLLANSDGSANNKIAAGLIAVLCIKFVKEAEEIVRKIFNFADDNKHTSLAAGAATAMVGMKFAGGAGKSAGMFAGKTVNFAVNTARNMPNAIANFGANAYALSTMLNSGGKTFEERKDDYYEKNDNEKADKEEEKLKKLEEAEMSKASTEEEKDDIKRKYTTIRTDMDKAISQRAAAIRNSNPEMSASRAYAKARKEEAEERRKNESPIHRSIKGVRNFGGEAANLVSKSKVIQGMGNLMKESTGLAFATVSFAGALNNGANAATAFGAGIAASKATTGAFEGFFKTTGGTLANNTKNNFIALGATDSTKMMEIANRVMANADDYDDADKLKELVDDIKNELKKVGLSDKEASKIHNNLRKGATAGKPFNPDTYLKGLVGNQNASEGLLKATRKLSNFENERSIFQAIQDSENLGKSSSSYVADVRSRTTASDYKRAKQFEFDSSEDLAIDARSGIVDTDGLNVNEKRRLEKDIDRALNNAKNIYDRQEGYEIESKALKDEIENLEKNKLKIQVELKQEYERNASELSRQLQEIKKEISKEEAKAKARDVLDKESFMREIEREARRREKEIEDLMRDAEGRATQKLQDKINMKKQELNIFKTNASAVADEVDE